MNLLDRFFDDGNDLASLRPISEIAELEAGYRSRATEGQGLAALPRNHAGQRWFYLFAWSEREGRELVELVRAWIGPALSDVQIRSLELNPDDPFDAVVLRAHSATAPDGRAIRVETLPRLGGGANFDQKRDSQRRTRLLQLLRAAERRPPSSFTGGRNTATVLRDLRLAIGAGGMERCRELLRELERSGDLDVPNLAFQEVKVLGRLGRWRELLELPMLPYLLAMRRPPGVSRLIEEAAYWNELESLDTSGDDRALSHRFAELCDRLPGLGAASPKPGTRGQAVVQFLQAATVAKDRLWSERVASAAAGIAPDLEERLWRLAPELLYSEVAAEFREDLRSDPAARRAAGDLEGAVDAAATTVSPAGIASALAAAIDLGTPEAAERVLDAVQPRIEAADEHLAGLPSIRAAVEDLRRAAAQAPRSWTEWFERCEIAGSASEALGWLSDRGAWEPLPASALLALLRSAGEAVRSLLAEASADVIEAHLANLTATDQHELLDTLLLGLAVSGLATPAALDQAYTLLELAVESAASQGRLRSMTESISLLLPFGSPNPDWVIDLLDVLASSSLGTDADTLLGLEQELIAVLRRTRRPLSPSNAARWHALCEIAPLTGPPTDLAVSAPSAEDSLSCLSRQRVGIYSLREIPARSAFHTLMQTVPEVEVVLNHDTKGSDALRNLAENCQVVVLVSVAATHSATDVLRAARGDRPIEYVNRTGAEAILEALRERCRRQSNG